MRKILLLLLLIFGFLLNILFFIYQNLITEIMIYISIIIICPLIILGVCGVFKSIKLNNFYYLAFHFIYLFLPVALIMIRNIKYTELNKFLIIFLIVLFTSFISCLILNNKMKYIDRKQLKHLEYWNLFMMTFFSITITVIKLFNNDMDLILYLFFNSPLLILQLVYKRIDLYYETNNIENGN